MRKSLRKIKNPVKAKINKRKLAIRKKVIGSSESPRICTVKTNKHLQIQVVDDAAMKTLFSFQTFGKKKVGDGANMKSAEELGGAVSSKLKELNLTRAVFDRNGRQYTGIVAKVADSIRAGGIQI